MPPTTPTTKAAGYRVLYTDWSVLVNAVRFMLGVDGPVEIVDDLQVDGNVILENGLGTSYFGVDSQNRLGFDSDNGPYLDSSKNLYFNLHTNGGAAAGRAFVFGTGAGGSGATALFLIDDYGVMWLKDGITAPSNTSGWAKIYVDTSDGDLKVKFGDGTTKTIVTDT